MADLSDVEIGLATLISGILYPNGTSQPSVVPVVAPYPNPIACYVYPGWPVPTKVEADLVANPPVVHISVYAMPGQERLTTRYERDWTVPNPITPSFTPTISGDEVTIGGTVTAGHFVTIHVNGNEYVASYAATSNDTLTSVATALTAQLVAAGVAATSSGTVITLPTIDITARAGCPQTAYVEIDRVMQRFCVTIWAPNHAIRSAVAKVIRPAIVGTDFLTMPDGYGAWLKYESSVDVDRSAKMSASTRDIHYWVEYAVTKSMTVYTLTTFVNEVMGQNTAYKIHPLPWKPGEFVPVWPIPPFTPTPPDSGPSLDFSDPDNSQYIATNF